MIYGTHTDKSVKYHTFLQKIFDSINNRQKEYNWLITDFICYPQSSEASNALGITPSGTDCPDYRFFSGEELTALIAKEDFQWIWGAFCGFEKHIPLSEILAHPLPVSESYAELYRLPVSMQHPLSCIEIYAEDSSATVFLSKDAKLTELYRAGFPRSTDLSEYIQNPNRQHCPILDIFRKI